MTANSVYFKIKNSKLAEILKNNDVDLAIDGDIIYSNRKGNKAAKWLEIGSEGNVEEAITQSNITNWMLEFLNFMGDVFCGGFSTLSENNVQEAREEIKELANEINNSTTEFEIKICCCSDEGFDNSFETYNFVDGKFVSTYISEYDYEERFPDDERPLCTAIIEEGPEGIEEILFSNTRTSNVKNAKTTSQKHTSNKKAATNDDFEISNNVLKKYAGPGGEVIVPDGVVSIGENVFEGRKDITKVVLPDGLKKIKFAAFWRCDQLVSINLPEGLNEIGMSAFCNCSSLLTIEIPDSVTKMGTDIFKGCSSLKEAKLPANIKTIPLRCFSQCEKLESIVIPETVSQIYSCAFNVCKSLEKIVFPKNLRYIESGAFAECEKLKSLPLFENLVGIGEHAFDDCPLLADNDGFIIINNILFGYYGNDKNVVVPDTVTRIDNFSNCDCVETILLPDTVNQIEWFAFGNCKNLVSITMPAKMKKVECTFVRDCPKFKKFIFSNEVKKFEKTIAKKIWDAFTYCKTDVGEYMDTQMLCCFIASFPASVLEEKVVKDMIKKYKNELLKYAQETENDEVLQKLR